MSDDGSETRLKTTTNPDSAFACRQPRDKLLPFPMTREGSPGNATVINSGSASARVNQTTAWPPRLPGPIMSGTLHFDLPNPDSPRPGHGPRKHAQAPSQRRLAAACTIGERMWPCCFRSGPEVCVCLTLRQPRGRPRYHSEPQVPRAVARVCRVREEGGGWLPRERPRVILSCFIIIIIGSSACRRAGPCPSSWNRGERTDWGERAWTA